MRVLVIIISLVLSVNTQTLQSNQRISAKKCEEYSKITTQSVHVGSLSLLPTIQKFMFQQCDITQGLILGGEDAKPGEFPHMVAIGFKEHNDPIRFLCAGSLISDKYVLTVAHCRKNNGRPPFLVRVGDLNLNLKEDDLPEEDINIEAYIYHEQYDPVSKINDIAVIRLVKSVTFSKYLRPACLAQPNIIFHRNKVIATGWGATVSYGGDVSDILKKVELDLFQSHKCSEEYENFHASIQYCAGILKGGKDTCIGDIGGPIQVRSEANKCIHIIVGITSYGLVYCGAENIPAVYTKVSSHLNWIERQVWGEQNILL